MGVKGFVKNMHDGSVYIEAEAESEILGEFVIWCRKGPDHARVEHIETEDVPVKNDNNFDLKF